MLKHWPEYVSECLGTGIMMVIGVGAIALFWGEGSLVPADVLPGRLRLLFTGLVFASGATLVVYSVFGQRSGGHINPAVTLAFWYLKKIPARDAVPYVIAQVAGATVGVFLMRGDGGETAASIRWGMTLPGEGISSGVAIVAEVTITFFLVGVILFFLEDSRKASRTGLAAGSLVALLVTLEAPISGTSLNPARSLGPALVAGQLEHLWIYLTAPLLGGWLGAVVYRSRWWSGREPACAKLYHTEKFPCIFGSCGFRLARAGETLLREGEPADCAYIVERGWVQVRKRTDEGAETVLADLGPLQWVGEMSLLLDEARSARVVALTDAQLRRVTREGFVHAIRTHPEKAVELMRQLAERVREASRRLVS